jgi:short-subunit dehydrogenase
MSIPAPRDGGAALITGASSGIGAELARQLCARGHDAILVARRRDRLEALAAELHQRHSRRVEVVACDLADAGARASLPAEVTRLGLDVDVLVLCAGFGMTGPFLSQPADRITLMIRTNVEAVMALSRALIPPMAARRTGAVLIVSSMAGNQPMPNFGAYAATKAAMTSFAQSLHCELKPSAVTVTALCPGGVRTEFSEVAGATRAERRTPSALMIGPEECARAGLQGLEQGRRMVMPRRAVRLFAWFGAHAPRSIWLPMCRRLFA